MEESYTLSVYEVKWGAFVLAGILALLLGLLIVMFPGLAETAIMVLFGILLVVAGLIVVINSLLAPAGAPRSVLGMLLGVLVFLAGIAAIIYPLVAGAIIAVVIAIFMFLLGITQIYLAMEDKGAPHRALLAISGILGILFAALVMIFPFLGGLVLFGVLIGVYFILFGLLSLASGFVIRSVQK